MKRILVLLLTTLLLSGCAPKAQPQTYTYHIGMTQMPSGWSPHSLVSAEAARLQELLYAPLCELTVLDTAACSYQWIFVAAEQILDVTADHISDLQKYRSVVPTDTQPEQGYVYEIRLRQQMQWEDGTPINADTYLYSMKALLDPKAANTVAASFFSGKAALAGAKTYGTVGGNFENTVGFYKVDDYTLRYVCLTSCTAYDLYTLLSNSFLVHPQLHAESGDQYATTAQTTLSCGPYRIASVTPGKQMVLECNKQYWEYGQTEDGEVGSISYFMVDGQKQVQFQTQQIVMEVMTPEEAAQAYQQGKLDQWTPDETVVAANVGSDRLYTREQTFTVRLFFHTDLSALEALDQAENNRNSVVLSNRNFRKAMSLALDRQKLTEATAGYVPTVSLISHLCYYDVQNDPASIYHKSETVAEAFYQLYEKEWDPGMPLDPQEDSGMGITGYEPEKAKELMAQACRELSEAGLYTPGEEIRIRVAWKSGKLDALDQQQIAVINTCLNEAMEDSGFGAVMLIPVGNLEDRYQDVSEGKYAIGLGAWGGSVFQPFGIPRMYCDPDYADPLHEAGCWDPDTEQLTLTVDGQEYTMTWKEWSYSMIGNGIFAGVSVDVKLEILAAMETQYLDKYYAIPLMNTADGYLLSGKVRNYTDRYNVLYGFGGLRLMRYNYSDQQWEEYLRQCDGNPYAAADKD